MNHWVVYLDSEVDGLMIANDEEKAIAIVRQTQLGQGVEVVTVQRVETAPMEDVVRGLAKALMNLMTQSAMTLQAMSAPRRGRVN